MGVIVNISSSFKDPGGNLFLYDGKLYRRISYSYRDNYDHLIESGLYKDLCSKGQLVEHEEVTFDELPFADTYKIIRPEKIDFISYPYEWCFSQLKHAALLTLDIQKTALNYGMTLKDCSAYNVQFKNGKPIFIDTLSFEKYKEGRPWVVYRQFCQHFLGPLSLMSLKDIRLSQLLRVYIDGIPLDLVRLLLPQKSRFILGLLLHIHLHARSQKRFENRIINRDKYRLSKSSLMNIIENLESSVKKLFWRPSGTEWVNYCDFSNYTERALEHKKDAIKWIISKFEPGVVLDLGANEGLFSRLIAKKAKKVISIDADPACVEKNYLECVKNNEKNIILLLIDLTNPSPGIGWQNKERMPFFERCEADTVMALALIHHLAITNNVPFENIAEFFSKICRFLITEFVPKTDSQVIKLLSARDDIFHDYNKDNFEKAFSKRFIIREIVNIIESERTLYLMERGN
ncbi:MAG TPA: class I SAM-dependent methyltransferase [Syntrophorhabdaceae bacterium]|nr:class I SAM-dependent methyltransferase [Syntrophorhabdaceae bacterium]